MSDYIYPNKTPVVVLECESAFNDLTEKEKLYAHHLSRACWYGGLIVLIQTSQESPLIFTLLHKLFRTQSANDLKKVALEECDFTEEEFTAFLVYTCALLTNMGNYKGMGDTKFIPNLPEEKFKKLIASSALSKEQPEDVKSLLSKCMKSIYSLEDSECRLGFPPSGTTKYLSKNITKEDEEIVKPFLKEQTIESWNSRLLKTTDEMGASCYEIRRASVLQNDDVERRDVLSEHVFNGHKFAVSRGDYSKLLELVNENLLLAKEFVANENQDKMIDLYMKSFRTGSLNDHKDGSRYWIKDKGPVIENYIGFIENYRDPAGMRAEFEGFVAMVNKKMSAKFTNLVSSAERFIPLLPWPNAYEKKEFLRPDFTSLDVLSFACSGLPAGICIPNYNEIRENEGFKNVSLGNVLSIKPKEPPNYLVKADQDIMLKYGNRSFELNVALHELLGHGSGRLFRNDKDGGFNFDVDNTINFETNQKVSSWYEDGETYDSVFGSISCAYEECRAECVALHLSYNQDILRIFSCDGSEADDIIYNMWLCMVLSGLEGLQMYSPTGQTWLQAHCQARYVILQVCLEAGQDFMKLEETTGADGKPDLLLTLDPSKLESVGRPALAKFLGRLQLYKSTADIESATKMFEGYSKVTAEGKHPFLNYREIVMARKKPRRLLFLPNTFVKDGKVIFKTYDSTLEDLIQSWIDRFPENHLYGILEELWAKDVPAFS